MKNRSKPPLARRLYRKAIKYLLILATGMIIFTGMLEWAYRDWWFEFYASEDHYYNQSQDTTGRPRILIFGDSFTACENGWVQQLRRDFPDYCFVNAAIPGTGIRETSLFAAERIARYRPRAVIYQFYPGNDLTDISHDTGPGNAGWLRELYWMISDRMQGIRYINYRMGRFRRPGGQAGASDTLFNPALYSPWQVHLYRARPSYLDETVTLREPQKGKADEWFQYLDDIRSDGQGIPFVVLLIPHPAQMGGSYYRDALSLGAAFGDSTAFLSADPAISQYMRNNCRLRNIFFADATDTLQKASLAGMLPYRINDIHLTGTGNAIVAGFAALQLINQNILSKPIQ